jgi:hypothetical protein
MLEIMPVLPVDVVGLGGSSGLGNRSSELGWGGGRDLARLGRTMFTKMFRVERFVRSSCGGASSVAVDALLCIDHAVDETSLVKDAESELRRPLRGFRRDDEDEVAADSADGSDGREASRSRFDEDALDASELNEEEKEGLDCDRPDGVGFGGGVGCVHIHEHNLSAEHAQRTGSSIHGAISGRSCSSVRRRPVATNSNAFAFRSSVVGSARSGNSRSGLAIAHRE